MKYSNLPLKRIIKIIHKDIEKIFLVEKEQIEEVLKSMIKERKILVTPEQSEDTFLNIIDRKTIFYCIEDNPGKKIEDLCRLLNLTKDQMIWHLTFLRKIHYIRSEKRKNEVVYYSNNHHITGGNSI
jgi:predicted transcriptional regulator